MDFTSLLSAISSILSKIDDVVWGPVIIVLILGTGLYLTLGLRFLSWIEIPRGFRLMWHGRKHRTDITGELSPFAALMTALAATVGTGNIAGVATAIFTGGPGALFWMWCTAMVGMATKFAESTLAMKYREITPAGNVVGGPMYFIKNGLGKNWMWLGTLFAVFGGLAGFGIGNMTQANSISSALETSFQLPTWVTAIILFVLTGAVFLGGVRRIGAVSSKVVPLMAALYIVCALIIVFKNLDQLPVIFSLVLREAFTPTAAQGGFAGATVMMAIRFGVARGIFSNEAGLGSAAIAQAAAACDNPVKMGLIGMLGTFIDTIIVCSMTGFAILVTGSWTSGKTGVPLTSYAFDQAFPGYGNYIVAVCLILFAFTTILGWCVYSERCWIYLFGDKAQFPFRCVFTLAVPVGAVATLDNVWTLADILNALMAVPNLIGLILLSPALFAMVKEYRTSKDKDNLFL